MSASCDHSSFHASFRTRNVRELLNRPSAEYVDLTQGGQDRQLVLLVGQAERRFGTEDLQLVVVYLPGELDDSGSVVMGAESREQA